MAAHPGLTKTSSLRDNPRKQGGEDRRNLLSTDGSPGDDFRATVGKNLGNKPAPTPGR